VRSTRRSERVSVLPPATSCPNCGARLETPARFCPECGVRLAGADDVTVEAIPPDETGQVPVRVTAAEPRYFGVTPPMAVLALAAASVALAIAAFVTGHVVSGILLLVAAAAFTALFVAAARRLPTNPISRVSGRAIVGLRDRAGYAADAVGAYSGAQLDLFRLRREFADLVAQRADAARSLGEAVYGGAAEDAAKATNLLSELDAAMAAKEAEMTRVATDATARIQRARLEVQPTAVVEPPNIPEPMPVPSEPPQPVTVPEPTPVPSEPPAPVPAPDPTPEPSPPMPETPAG
jgi:hypothetical protein